MLHVCQNSNLHEYLFQFALLDVLDVLCLTSALNVTQTGMDQIVLSAMLVSMGVIVNICAPVNALAIVTKQQDTVPLVHLVSMVTDVMSHVLQTVLVHAFRAVEIVMLANMVTMETHVLTFVHLDAVMEAVSKAMATVTVMLVTMVINVTSDAQATVLGCVQKIMVHVMHAKLDTMGACALLHVLLGVAVGANKKVVTATHVQKDSMDLHVS